MLLHFSTVIAYRPLPPAWSPDHQVLATTKVPEDFVTPEGGNYSALLNGRAVYPLKTKDRFADFYANWHTFLSDFTWSPDSQRVAFVEKIYDWQYSEPFNQYFFGRVSSEKFFLVILSRQGQVTGYKLPGVSKSIHLEWRDSNKIVLNDQTYDISANPPQSIP